MVRVSIDVDGAAVRSRLLVRAESIQGALRIAGERNPGCALRVVFPLDPETFFVRETDSEPVSEIAA
ncbi:MAG: hypothetical protein ACRDTR_20905 [Rubrobacter sp.]